jgi:hypothetical protein
MSTYCRYQGSTRNDKHVCSYDDTICNNECPEEASGSGGSQMKNLSKVLQDVAVKNYKLIVDNKEMDFMSQKEVNLLQTTLDLGWITLCSNVKIVEK